MQTDAKKCQGGLTRFIIWYKEFPLAIVGEHRKPWGSELSCPLNLNGWFVDHFQKSIERRAL